jgi:hypothetical protein
MKLISRSLKDMVSLLVRTCRPRPTIPEAMPLLAATLRGKGNGETATATLPPAPTFHELTPVGTDNCLGDDDRTPSLLDTFTTWRTADLAPPTLTDSAALHVNADGSSYSLEGAELHWINENGARHFISEHVTSFQAAPDGTLCYRQAGGELVLWPARGEYVPVADGVTAFRLTDNRRVYFLRTNGNLYGFREGAAVTFQAGGVAAFEAAPDGRVFFLDADGSLRAFRGGTMNRVLADKVRSFNLTRNGKVLFRGTDGGLYGCWEDGSITRLVDDAMAHPQANGPIHVWHAALPMR